MRRTEKYARTISATNAAYANERKMPSTERNVQQFKRGKRIKGYREARVKTQTWTRVGSLPVAQSVQKWKSLCVTWTGRSFPKDIPRPTVLSIPLWTYERNLCSFPSYKRNDFPSRFLDANLDLRNIRRWKIIENHVCDKFNFRNIFCCYY